MTDNSSGIGFTDETGSYCCSDKHENLADLAAKLIGNFYAGTAPLPDGVEEDDGITCDCDHRRPKRGWKGKLPVPVDGNTWPLDFAAKTMGVSEKDLRDLIRILEVEPEGTMKMASYRRSGRNPRAYNASLLVNMWQDIQDLRERLKNL